MDPSVARRTVGNKKMISIWNYMKKKQMREKNKKNLKLLKVNITV